MELDKRVYVSEIKEKLNLEQICGDKESLTRWVIAPDVNRPGLELSGFNDEGELRRVVIIGNKETKFLDTLSPEVQRERFNFITDSYTPCIIISSKSGCPKVLLEVAGKKNFPIFLNNGPTYELTTALVSFLSEKLAPTTHTHGVMMNIYGKGILLIGDSGVGKSELALDLINRGHMLVADDDVELALVHNTIWAKAPYLLEKQLELRGIGVIDVVDMFGVAGYTERIELEFAIKLSKQKDGTKYKRLEANEQSLDILGIKVPILEIPVASGKSMSAIIEAAVKDHVLKTRGIDSTENFKNKVYEEIKRRSEGKGNY